MIRFSKDVAMDWTQSVADILKSRISSSASGTLLAPKSFEAESVDFKPLGKEDRSGDEGDIEKTETTSVIRRSFSEGETQVDLISGDEMKGKATPALEDQTLTVATEKKLNKRERNKLKREAAFVQNLPVENQRLKTQIQNLKLQIEEFEKQNAQWNALKSQLRQSQQTEKVLKDRIQRIEHEKQENDQKLQLQYQHKTEELGSLIKNLKLQAKVNAKRFEESIKQAKEELILEKASSNKLRKQNSQLQQQLEDLKEVDALFQELASYKLTVNQLQQENAELKQAVQAKEQRLKRIFEEFKYAQQRNKQETSAVPSGEQKVEQQVPAEGRTKYGSYRSRSELSIRDTGKSASDSLIAPTNIKLNPAQMREFGNNLKLDPKKQEEPRPSSQVQVQSKQPQLQPQSKDLRQHSGLQAQSSIEMQSEASQTQPASPLSERQPASQSLSQRSSLPSKPSPLKPSSSPEPRPSPSAEPLQPPQPSIQHTEQSLEDPSNLPVYYLTISKQGSEDVSLHPPHKRDHKELVPAEASSPLPKHHRSDVHQEGSPNHVLSTEHPGTPAPSDSLSPRSPAYTSAHTTIHPPREPSDLPVHSPIHKFSHPHSHPHHPRPPSRAGPSHVPPPPAPPLSAPAPIQQPSSYSIPPAPPLPSNLSANYSRPHSYPISPDQIPPAPPLPSWLSTTPPLSWQPRFSTSCYVSHTLVAPPKAPSPTLPPALPSLSSMSPSPFLSHPAVSTTVVKRVPTVSFSKATYKINM